MAKKTPLELLSIKMKMKIRRKVNNFGQWMKMEVPKRILKVRQLIDDLNEVEI
jgi:hypothetical protein